MLKSFVLPLSPNRVMQEIPCIFTSIFSTSIFAGVITACYLLSVSACINVLHIIICLYSSLSYSFFALTFYYEHFQTCSKDEQFYRQHCTSSSRLGHYHLFLSVAIHQGPSQGSPLSKCRIPGVDNTKVLTSEINVSSEEANRPPLLKWKIHGWVRSGRRAILD